jgi:outer membrane protein assembly factor BamB
VLRLLGINQGIVYVASRVVSRGQVDTIFALNASDGSVRWQAPLQDTRDLGGVLTQGVVYVGTANGMVSAFNASTGKQLWDVRMPSTGEGPSLAGDVRLVANGVVLYAHNGDFFALNASDGSLRWHRPQMDEVGLLDLGADLVARSRDPGTSPATNLIVAFTLSDGAALWDYPVAQGSVFTLLAG